MHRVVALVALASVLLIAALGAQPAAPHVVLITIDGLRGDYLNAAKYPLHVPTLRRMIREGTVSERTISVFPTLTGTAHTSLVTGVSAGAHGILGNNRFDPDIWSWTEDNYDRQPPYREFSEIHAETLWSAARAKGMKTAAIGWPQTAGGPIDYRIDISVAATAAESHTRTARSASPGWLDRIESKLGPIAATDLRFADHMKAVVAAQILEQLRPEFMAVHFALTDSVQHANGPGTAAAFEALEESDGNVAIVLEAIASARLTGSATVILTGDHGFLPMHTQLAINLPLVDAGLISKGADGKPSWTAIVAPNRGLGSLYLKNAADTDVLAKARAAFDKYAAAYPRRFRILERRALDAWGADPRAVLGIEPIEGYVLDARLGPPFAMAHDRAAGHGYRPDTPGMETGLIVWGAAARAAVVVPVSNTIDVAPTIARILGVALPRAEGQPLVGALK
jgi:arylsulfatase A-like enzyme